MGLLQALDELADPLRRSGYPVEVRAEHGPAGRVLRDAAQDAAADLIVVGSRGRGAAASALLGSVSAEVADHATCPVLVARQPLVSRMLLATDGSASAKGIPAILNRWRILQGIPIDVLSVASVKPASMDLMVTPWAPSVDDSTSDRELDIERHYELADSLACDLERSGRPVTRLVRSGDAAHEIVAAAVERSADLIVTGSRGLGDLQRLVLGSVAHHVLLHSHCSVMIMRGHVPARLTEAARVARGVPTVA
jgi:nucleotide-binding universal stress UspA family protein